MIARDSRAVVAAAAVAALLGAIVWSRALANGFVHVDDPYYLTNNPLVQRGLTWDGVVAAFTTTQVWNWHPLTMLSHMLDVELFGLDPAGHHAMSVALHLVAAALLFAAVREATPTRDPWVALFVAVAFAMHPLRVQSVAWASERKDVLSGAFWFAALWAHVRFARGRTPAQSDRPSPDGGSSPWGRARIATVALGVCAMLSKPMAVTLPLTLLLLDAWPLDRLRTLRDLRARVFEQAPLFLAAVVVAAMTVLAQDEAIQHAVARAPELRWAAGIVALPRYLGMIAFPWPLSSSHGLYQEQPPAALAFAALLCLAALTFALVRLRERSPWLLVGWLWFVATLAPVLGIIQVGSQAVADRYTYIPTVGALIAVAWHARGARFAAPAATLAVALLAWRTWVEIPAWRDPLSLADYAVAADPDDVDARIQRAIALGDAGRFPEAIEELERATSMRANAHAYDLLGQAYLRTNQPAQAIATLETATTIDARLAKVYVHLAESYEALSLRAEARTAVARALELEPDSARARALHERLR